MQPALFLDRDGTLMLDTGYPSRVDQVILLPWAVDALLEAQKMGYALVVVTNQSGIGRDIIARADADVVRAMFLAKMAQMGVAFHGYYECPHHPDVACRCRKPMPGLVHQATAQLGLDVQRSWVIGDKSSDINLAGWVPGLRALQVPTNCRWYLPPLAPVKPPPEPV